MARLFDWEGAFVKLVKARLLLVAVSGAVALVLAESATRVLGLSKTWNSYGAEHELNLRDLVTPEPVGFTRQPGATWRMPRGFTFTANPQGFRDRPFSTQKVDGTLRVAFLGDSLTEGYGVDESARFSNVAIRRLNGRGGTPYEGQNFGVVGQSTADEYLVLVRHALKFRPDVVVLQIGWNDFGPNLRKLPVVEGRAPPDSVRAFVPPSPASGSTVKISAVKAFLQEHSALYLAVAERASALRLRRGGQSAILETIVTTAPEEWEATRRIAEMFVGACHAAGARPILAYFPMDVEVLAGDESRAAFASRKVRAIAAGVGAETVDLLGPLRAHRGEDLYLDDVHLTTIGHQVAADALAAAIAR